MSDLRSYVPSYPPTHFLKETLFQFLSFSTFFADSIPAEENYPKRLKAVFSSNLKTLYSDSHTHLSLSSILYLLYLELNEWKYQFAMPFSQITIFPSEEQEKYCIFRHVSFFSSQGEVKFCNENWYNTW